MMLMSVIKFSLIADDYGNKAIYHMVLFPANQQITTAPPVISHCGLDGLNRERCEV